MGDAVAEWLRPYHDGAPYLMAHRACTVCCAGWCRPKPCGSARNAPAFCPTEWRRGSGSSPTASQIEADVIVGADGINSTCARACSACAGALHPADGVALHRADRMRADACRASAATNMSAGSVRTAM